MFVVAIMSTNIVKCIGVAITLVSFNTFINSFDNYNVVEICIHINLKSTINTKVLLNMDKVSN